ncbi:hypothetical protein LIER_07009 [Lithospermum erythrorhizon]|uniref:Uncharacterized protein n=1 Tax=Lithospermum erythrorhizon TaxID=34254 RepID=A0AAV3P7V4_LITER
MNPAQVSNSNVLAGALEAMWVTTRQATKRLIQHGMTSPTCERDIEYFEDQKPTQLRYSSPSSYGFIPSSSMERSQSRYGSHGDSDDSYISFMIMGITTIEEQIASLT